MVPACCAHTSRARRQGWCEERCMGVAGWASHRGFGRRHVFRRKSPTASAPAQLERTWGAGKVSIPCPSNLLSRTRRVIKTAKTALCFVLTFISERLCFLSHIHLRTPACGSASTHTHNDRHKTPQLHPAPPPKPRQHPSCRRGLELGPVVEPLRHHDLADDLPVRSELDPLPTLLAGGPEDLALQPGEGGLLLVAQALLHCIQV